MSPAARWTLLTAALMAAILVPFALFDEAMTEWADGVLQGGRSRGLLAAAVIGLLGADVLLPIPSSLVSLAAGALLGFATGSVAVWIGMTFGAWIGYFLGRRWGRAVTRRWVGEEELGRAERLHRRLGPAVIVLARGVPVLAEATVVFAGIAAMPRTLFLTLAAMSNAALALLYAALGARLIDWL